MSDDKFDAIVVGAGVAGSVAALVMARAGLDVLVIERGDSAGCKNMTGGRLYAHTLEAIIPGFAASAPIERKVTREKISFLTEESAVTLDFHREQPDVPQHASYTVLRNRLDPWLSRILLQLADILHTRHTAIAATAMQFMNQINQAFRVFSNQLFLNFVANFRQEIE